MPHLSSTVRRAGGNESLIAVADTIWMRCPQSCYSEALDVKIRPAGSHMWL